jgi:hypothetical protein
MLSCLRSIVRHQSTRFRPAFAAASFSTSVSRKNKPSADYQQIVGTLMEEGNKREVEEEDDDDDGDDEFVGKSFMGMFLAVLPKASHTEDFLAKGEEGTRGPRRYKIRGFRRNAVCFFFISHHLCPVYRTNTTCPSSFTLQNLVATDVS